MSNADEVIETLPDVEQQCQGCGATGEQFDHATNQWLGGDCEVCGGTGYVSGTS